MILALYVPFGLEQEVYDNLAKIAPTVCAPEGTPDGGISWQDLTRITGVALGKEQEAKDVVASVEARFEKAKKDTKFTTSTALNAYPAGDGTFQAYPPPDPGGRILVDLGFKVPEPIVDLAKGEAWVDLSAEQLQLMDADALVWLVEDYGVRDELKADPLYQQLRAPKEGRDLFFAYEEDAIIASAMSMQTVLSLPQLLDAIVPKLSVALDGDPKTTA